MSERKTKTINLTGTGGKSYDLDQMEQESRLNSELDLIVQVHNFNPKSSDPNKRRPNPENPQVGQIWLSKVDKSIV